MTTYDSTQLTIHCIMSAATLASLNPKTASSDVENNILALPEKTITFLYLGTPTRYNMYMRLQIPVLQLRTQQQRIAETIACIYAKHRASKSPNCCPGFVIWGASNVGKTAACSAIADLLGFKFIVQMSIDKSGFSATEAFNETGRQPYLAVINELDVVLKTCFKEPELSRDQRTLVKDRAGFNDMFDKLPSSLCLVSTTNDSPESLKAQLAEYEPTRGIDSMWRRACGGHVFHLTA